MIQKLLQNIEQSISTGIFVERESAMIELKDLSSGNDWKSLKETVCAYLNTQGGYVICGIREKENKYTITGFNRKNEGGLIELQSKFFKNEQDVLLNLSENIVLEYAHIGDKTVAIVQVLPLRTDLKYVKFEEKYYERTLTQDKIIPSSKLLQQLDYKREIEYAKEISPVLTASLSDLSVAKINQFILKINANISKETLKKDLDDALNFLDRKYCLDKNKQVTLLGLLLFGKEPERILENRARLDAYFGKTGEIGSAKKYFEGDVLTLMDEAFAFVWGHIEIGSSYKNGGRSEPEFPEELIREVINNALAHRDYLVNQFVTIKIRPRHSIEIKNPGSFKPKMLVKDSLSNPEIRRILQGIPETKNPKLASILKTFDKIESQGMGMAILVSKCLDNQIDVPYYDLSIPEMISLTIPSGKLIDAETQSWLNVYQLFMQEKLGKNLTKSHELVLAYLRKSEQLNQKKYYTILLSHNNNHLDVLQDLYKAGLIAIHEGASTDNMPIYGLNRELMIVDFLPIISYKTGLNMQNFSPLIQQILTCIYQNNHYNHFNIRANVIIQTLYNTIYAQEIAPTKYESFGKKVRKICRELSEENILTKHKDKSYQLNLRHETQNS